MQIQIPDIASRFLKENATTVLTAGGVVGTVTTAVIAFRAGMKSADVLNEETKQRQEYLSTTDKVKLVAPHVVPPVILGGVTVTAIIMSHRMSAAKAAALAAAYGVSQKQLDEYKAKMAEKLGINKMDKAKAEMAQERADNTPGSGAVIIYGDEVLCFDAPTGRYFKSTMERINQAANATNSEILKHNYAPASMFYSELELPSTTWSNDVGWDMPFQLDIDTILVDGKPCISINFDDMPFLDYQRSGRGRERYS